MGKRALMSAFTAVVLHVAGEWLSTPHTSKCNVQQGVLSGLTWSPVVHEWKQVVYAHTV